MEEEGDVTVLREDHTSLNTFSSTYDTKETRKVVLVEGGNCITRAIQDKIYSCIDFQALMHAVESGITKAIENLRLKVDLEDPLSAEYMNKMMMTAELLTATYL
jgi:hypothetical protein